MKSDKKVLTVSYGAFSCTLEGFEDSIGTLKAIAEYFCELAAKDREFGAQRLHPDADMLSRVAQGETADPVETHIDDSGVYLRASEAPARSEADGAQAADAQELSHPDLHGGSDSITPDAATSVNHAMRSIERSHSAATAEDPFGTPVEEFAGDDFDDAPLRDDRSAGFRADRRQDTEDDFGAAEDISDAPEAESLADKLQRIRAVVSQSDDPAAEYCGDEHAEAIVDDAGAARIDEIDQFFGSDSTAGAKEFEDLMEEPGDPGDLDDSFARIFEGVDDPGVAEEEDARDASDAGLDDDAYDAAAVLTGGDADETAREATVDPSQGPAARALSAEGDRSDPKASGDGPSGDAEADADGYEDELDRLMADADSHMGEPESSSRRDAFDRLRGVVAATMADDQLNGGEDAAEDPYRTDLAAAVTPRRPVATGRAERPRDQRPAPLTLVAEQRVDLPSTSSGPVRPRRVASDALAEDSEDDGGFADYAKAHGAHDLPDLLEAAAAYLSFVEDREQFTRPQLMAKVRQIDPDRFSREETLHQFGILLRVGKIEKIGGGRFTVSDDIGFRPEGDREAG